MQHININKTILSI